MSDKKKLENERKFGNWEDNTSGRRYYYTVLGRNGWSARYVKEVDSEERTRAFYQEIYDNNGRLVEIHKKFPVDEGHKKVGG